MRAGAVGTRVLAGRVLPLGCRSMRVPETERRRTFRGRVWAIAAVVVLVVLLFSLRGLAVFYTDYLWFDSIGQGGTWGSLLAAKVAPALVFTVGFFAIMFVNLIVADRVAPRYRSMGPEDELIARYQEVAGPYTGRIRVAVSCFFALIAGVGVSSQWRQWILFTNHVDFGVKDPQFHKDIGFYVFQLPFLQFIAEWLFAGLVIVLVVTAIEHYLNGGIRFQTPFQRVTPQVKAHLSVIVALMALVKTAQYYLGRFDLALSTRGVVDGAGYTDVHARLPAIELLLVISIVAAALFLWNIRRRGWVLPVIAVGLWALVALFVGTIYPAGVQRFTVSPNEYQAESKYITRNIDATRAAFSLKVNEKDFNFTTFDDVTKPADVVSANLPAIDNARLWDPDVLRSTYQTLQGLQTYYQIGDVDIDRYTVDNQTRQVLIAARGLNNDDLPSQSFVNRHIVYTHGYGIVASPSNEATDDGSPKFLLRDVPEQVGDESGLSVASQRAYELYFGENISDYVLVGAKSPEFNYQRAGTNDQFTRYQGKDGVQLSNVVRRAAFALRFGDINPLISGQVTSKTRVLIERDIVDRVHKLAPFLRYDADPYPVSIGDHVLWVMDAYTTTNQYPYSQGARGSGGLSNRFNYVRNSVKVTVDAYDGTVKFYVVDPSDPIITAYEKAFPDLFTDGSKMSDELRAHLRYPEDLFKVQAAVYGRYHVTEARRFYNQNGQWLVSPDPGSGVVSSTDVAVSSGTSGTAARTPQAASSTGKRIPPYYLYLRLPGDTEASFVELIPFVPISSGNSQTRLVSFLTASSDPKVYGQLRSFVMPQGQTVLGPTQVDNEIKRTENISEQITLLSRGGSQVIFGSLQLIPVGDSNLVYVRPVYVQGADENGFPKFQFVVVFTQGKPAVRAATVAEGLQQLFGGDVVTSPGGGTTTPGQGTTPTTTAPPTSGTSVADLLSQAQTLFDQANAALKNGDLGQYQQLVNKVQQLVTQASQLAKAGS